LSESVAAIVPGTSFVGIVREHCAPEVQKTENSLLRKQLSVFCPSYTSFIAFSLSCVVLTAAWRLCRWDVVFFSFSDSVVSV
jgi:hypothetical protein